MLSLVAKDEWEPWRWGAAWVHAIAVYNSVEDGSNDDPVSTWILTHTDLQQRLVDRFAGVFEDIAELVDNQAPQAHYKWEDFAPLMMDSLRALLPGAYYGAPLTAYTDISAYGLDRQTVFYTVGLPGSAARPNFGITLAREDAGWRVTNVEQCIELPSADKAWGDLEG